MGPRPTVQPNVFPHISKMSTPNLRLSFENCSWHYWLLTLPVLLLAVHFLTLSCFPHFLALSPSLLQAGIHGLDFFCRVDSASFESAGGALREHVVSPKMRLLPRVFVGSGRLGPASQSAGPVLTSLKNRDPPPKRFAKPLHALSTVLEVSFHLWLNIECSCIHRNCWNIFILDYLNGWGM